MKEYVSHTSKTGYIKFGICGFILIVMVLNTYKSLFAFFIVGCFGCSKSEEISITPQAVPVTETVSAEKPVATGITLQNSLPFPFGAAVNINFIKLNPVYKAHIIKEYKSLTAESGMKIRALHPEEKRYQFTDADYLVNFAMENNKRVHGHTLIWDSSLPGWIKDYKGDAKAWEALFKSHIQTVVSHFKGRVASWDVVNEAFKDNGSLDDTFWYKKLGPDYIARAFQYAHAADPKALLFYNDYGHEYGNNKRRGIVKYVNELKARGIPIHGIGMQMHSRYNLSDADFARAINEVAATGLKVHISELDISLNPQSNKTLKLTPELEKLQAQKYKFIVKTYNAIPKAQQFGITTWNVTDGDSWIMDHYNRPDWPLPFDANYNKKPAYQGILDGVK